MRRWARSRLRTRIFIAFSALLLAVLLATLGFTQWVVSREAERTLRHELVTTGEVFERLVRERSTRLQSNSQLLARDFALKRVLATYFDPASFDPATLESAAQSYQGRIGVELLWIADDAGTLLVSLPAAPKAGREMAGFPPLKEALDSGAPSSSIAAVDGTLFQLVAVPVFAPDVIGYLVLGHPIDDGFAAQLKEATGSDVSFLTRDGVYASTWPRQTRELLLQSTKPRTEMLAKQNAKQASLLTISGERFLSLVVPVEASLPQPLAALVQGSYDQALAPLRALQWRIAAIGAAALLLALLIGIAIARGITSPLQALVAGTKEVVRGNLRYGSKIEREDQIGFLARSFNDMVGGLEEREHIKNTFGRFVSRDVNDRRAEREMSRSRASTATLTTSCSEDTVRGFTRLSEKLDPAALLKILNQFFTEVVAAVEDRRRRRQAVHRPRRHGALWRPAIAPRPARARGARGARHQCFRRADGAECAPGRPGNCAARDRRWHRQWRSRRRADWAGQPRGVRRRRRSREPRQSGRIAHEGNACDGACLEADRGPPRACIRARARRFPAGQGPPGTCRGGRSTQLPRQL